MGKESESFLGSVVRFAINSQELRYRLPKDCQQLVAFRAFGDKAGNVITGRNPNLGVRVTFCVDYN